MVRYIDIIELITLCLCSILTQSDMKQRLHIEDVLINISTVLHSCIAVVERKAQENLMYEPFVIGNTIRQW
jgi:hypothetical protein